MDDAEKSEGNEKESPPLQIDPKWYVQHPPSFALFTTDWAAAQLPRRFEIFLSAHQDR